MDQVRSYDEFASMLLAAKHNINFFPDEVKEDGEM
tara:strand:+ start:2180 stop:2284 length:105 start_codon:yes stop_codon:yes gene_type:complete